MTQAFRFFGRAVIDEPATRENGSPVYMNEDAVEIHVDAQNSLTRRADEWIESLRGKMERAGGEDRGVAERHYDRAVKAYDRYKNGRPDEIEGRPLDTWARMTPDLVMTLSHHLIYSIEQLAEASDTIVSKVPNGIRLRKEARAMLEQVASDAANVLQVTVNEQQAMIAALQQQILELKKELETDEAPKRRTRKAAA